MILISLNILECYSESSTFTFNNPELGSVTSIRPTIKFNSAFKIDTSTFKMNRLLIADFIYDPPVLGDTINRDTILEVYPNAPNFLLIPKSVYLEEPDSIWWCYHVPGNITFIDEMNVEYKPNKLSFNTEYCAIIKGVSVLLPGIGGWGTVLIENTSTTFTTAKNLNYMIECIFDKKGNQINCNDTLKFEFTEHIESLTTPIGDLIELYSVSRAESNDSIVNKVFTEQELITWLNEDSTEILALPLIPFSTDSNYILSVILSRLTGDTLNNIGIPFYVKDSYSLELTAGLENTTETFDPLFSFLSHTTGIHYYHIDENVEIMAPLFYNDYSFKEWQCEQDEIINGNTSNTLTLNQSCEIVRNLSIKGIYEPVATEQVWVQDNENLNISVYNKDFELVGGSGTYTLKRDGEDEIIIDITPSASFTLLNWTSNLIAYDGYKGSIYTVKSDPYENPYRDPTGISIGFDDIEIEVEEPKYILDLVVNYGTNKSYWDENHDIKDFIEVLPDLDYSDGTKHHLGKEFVYSEPCTVNVDVHRILPIDDVFDCDCYRISFIRIEKKGPSGGNSISYCEDHSFVAPHFPYRTEWSEDIVLDNTYNYIKVYIEINRKWDKLEAEAYVNNGNIGLEDDISLKFYNDGKEVNYRDGFNESGCYILNKTSYNNSRLYDIRRRCGPGSAKVQPKYNEYLYSFSKFNDEPGYYANPGGITEYCNIPKFCEDYTAETAKKVQAKFTTEFNLIKVGIANNQRNIIEYYSISRLDDVLKNSSVFLHSQPNTAIIDFVFSHPINTNSVLNKNILFTDFSIRLDDQEVKKSTKTFGYESKLFSYFPGSAQNNYSFFDDNKTVRCTLTTAPNINIPKIEAFFIDIKGGPSGIVSSNNDNLVRDYKWYGHTEDANVKVTLYKIKPLSDLFHAGEGDNAEIFCYYLRCEEGNFFHTPKASKKPDIFKFWSANENEWKVLDEELLNYTVGHNIPVKNIYFGISFWENDNPDNELDISSNSVANMFIIPYLESNHDPYGGGVHACPETYLRNCIYDSPYRKWNTPIGSNTCSGASDHTRLTSFNRYGAVPQNPRYLEVRNGNHLEYIIKYIIE
jgi:hypothetical protein